MHFHDLCQPDDVPTATPFELYLACPGQSICPRIAVRVHCISEGQTQVSNYLPQSGMVLKMVRMFQDLGDKARGARSSVSGFLAISDGQYQTPVWGWPPYTCAGRTTRCLVLTSFVYPVLRCLTHSMRSCGPICVFIRFMYRGARWMGHWAIIWEEGKRTEHFW
jgi:hypothetical protein